MKKPALAIAIAALGLASADASAQVRRDRDGSFPSARARANANAKAKASVGVRAHQPRVRAKTDLALDRRAAAPPARRSYDPAPSIISMYPSYGAPGTDVTIRGKSFQRGVMVKVGGTWVTPRSVTPRRLVFTVPADARDGRVLIKQSRSRAVKAGSFNVVRQPVKNQRTFRASAAVRAEKQAHDRRIARLDRMIRQSSNDSILRRWLVNLRQRETARHQRKMTNLRQRYFASVSIHARASID